MTQEDKDLLLKDLCARQMHNVKCRVKYSFNNETTNGRDVWTEDDDTIKMVNPEYEEVFISYISEWVDIENVKPYLRPMSSMTEEEKGELSDYLGEQVMSNKIGITIPPNPTQGKGIPFIWMGDCLDWLNKNMFDYRGLIPMGLALEAPEDMYK